MMIVTFALTAALAAAPPPASADACAPLHAALARLYHTPLKRHSTLRPEGGEDGTTEYVLTADRQYVRFPNGGSWMSTPLGEADRAALDGGLKGLTAREGLVCTMQGEETLGSGKTRMFLIDDAEARSKIQYWVSVESGLVVKSITELAHGASLTDVYEYGDVKAPQ